MSTSFTLSAIIVLPIQKPHSPYIGANAFVTIKVTNDLVYKNSKKLRGGHKLCTPLIYLVRGADSIYLGLLEFC